ncbi:MAG: hypothetical protein ACLURV_08705 [Gallintestinimicrobium sp.]
MESAELCNGGGRSGAYHAMMIERASCMGFNPAVYSGVMLVRMYMLWLCGFCSDLAACKSCRRETGFPFYLPLMAVVYLGFLTHYYFAVYLFPGSGDGAVSAVGTQS